MGKAYRKWNWLLISYSTTWNEYAHATLFSKFFNFYCNHTKSSEIIYKTKMHSNVYVNLHCSMTVWQQDGKELLYFTGSKLQHKSLWAFMKVCNYFHGYTSFILSFIPIAGNKMVTLVKIIWRVSITDEKELLNVENEETLHWFVVHNITHLL
jgi:hypothetical protein